MERASARADAELLAGNAEDFGHFYARHEDHVLALFLRRTASAEPAADLVAEAFAPALVARRRFDPTRGEARAWLTGIARHLLADSLTRGRVEDRARRRLGLERLCLDDASIAAVDEFGGEAALAALGELPPTLGHAVRARVLREEDYDELATQPRCSPAVARKRVSHGLRALRHRLEGQA